MSEKWHTPAYLNGCYMPVEEAKISVLDRGFLFGDGVYEIIQAYGGRLFCLDQHLQRLARSLAEIQLENPYSFADWADILNGIIARALGDDLAVYLQVTRGVAPRDHAFPVKPNPTVFAMARPLVLMSPETLAKGVSAILAEDIRWRRCNIKSISLLGNILLRQRAVDNAAAEAILFRDGYVTEGAASNLFIVRQGTLITPPNSEDLLPGVTRDIVLELARDHGIKCRESPIPCDVVYESDEVWLTSSIKEILPVVSVDDRVIGEGRPGPMWEKIHSLFQSYKTAMGDPL